MFIYELYNMLLKEKYLDIKKINYDEYLIRIHSIIEYTHNHYSEKISLEKLSEITGISTFRVSHFVKDVLGISYRDFLQNSRFENAIKRIRQTDESIADIAKDCGFSDQKYLNQMMKRRFDMTTLKYRMIWRSTDDSGHMTFNASDFIEELKICLDRIEIDNNLQDTFGLSKN